LHLSPARPGLTCDLSHIALVMNGYKVAPVEFPLSGSRGG
jgi:hypothetical protein